MKYRILLAAFVFLFCNISKAQQQYYLLTGTYTSPNSEGIYVYRFNSADGSAKEVSHVKISNPSFVAVSPNEQFVYSVEEDAANNGKGGEITAFSFNKDVPPRRLTICVTNTCSPAGPIKAVLRIKI